jgi:glycosyltransferase involved in cell wall biosynthesis
MLEKRKPENTDKPRVSVVMIFFNGEAFLAEAIESVRAQTFKDWEFLLVDDGSGPAATAIAKDYAARYRGKIRYLDHPDHANRGMSATRNLGIRHARGEFIAFLDADDIWLPSKLAEHVALLDKYQDVGMVCGATVYWHSWSGGKDRIDQTGHKQDVVIYPPDSVPAVFPLGTAAPPSMSDIVLRTTLMRELSGFEEQFTGHYESRAFLSKVYLSTPVYFSSAVSNKYRQHPASCVQTAFREGTHVQNRLDFLEWFEKYLQTKGQVDPRVTQSLQRALLPYRHPRLHYLLSLTEKVRSRLKIGTRFRQLINRATHLIHRQAS